MKNSGHEDNKILIFTQNDITISVLYNIFHIN